MYEAQRSRLGAALDSNQPIFAGICARLADDFALSPGVVRLVAILFLLLPTWLSYLLLAYLSRRAVAGGAHPVQSRLSTEWAQMRDRFADIEPRLKSIEAFVTSSDFELRRGFRRMEE